MKEWGNDLGFTHAAQIYLLGIAYTWTPKLNRGSRTTYLSCSARSYRLIPRCLNRSSQGSAISLAQWSYY